jgi:putative Mn2+ efflux pump MntP
MPSSPQTLLGFFGAGILAAVAHALLPSHWLPFLAAARAHGWSRQRLLGFTLLVASTHALVTVSLGFIVAVLGTGVTHFFHEHAPKIAGLILVALGGSFLAFPRLFGHRHIHHPECEHAHHGQAITLGGLFLTLALSPCEGLLPVFFATSVKFGWTAALVLAAITSLITVTLLVGIVMGAERGWEQTLGKLEERHERWLVSGLLILLGILMLAGKWH